MDIVLFLLFIFPILAIAEALADLIKDKIDDYVYGKVFDFSEE